MSQEFTVLLVDHEPEGGHFGEQDLGEMWHESMHQGQPTPAYYSHTNKSHLSKYPFFQNAFTHTHTHTNMCVSSLKHTLKHRRAQIHTKTRV